MGDSLVRTGSPGADSRAAIVAAGHLHFSPWRVGASAEQYADAVDVRARTGTGVGEKEVPQLFFHLRRWRGDHHYSGESGANAVGPSACGYSDDRRLWGDFWNIDCERDPVSRSAHMAVSPAADDSDAAVCGGDGGGGGFLAGLGGGGAGGAPLPFFGRVGRGVVFSVVGWCF